MGRRCSTDPGEGARGQRREAAQSGKGDPTWKEVAMFEDGVEKRQVGEWAETSKCGGCSAGLGGVGQSAEGIQ